MVNDTSYMFLIISFFLASALIVPLIQSDFGVSVTNNNVNNLVDGVTNSSDLGFFESLVTSSDEFEVTGSGNNPEVNTTVTQSTSNRSVNPASIIRLFFLMFFWTFGAIPPIFDLLIYLPFRLILLYLIIRFFRGNG